MTVQYLCCLNATQMATVRHVVAAHPFPKLAVHFGEVICRTASFIATVDAETQRTLGISVRDARNQYLAYHDGRNGYRRGTYRAKPWLMRVSGQIEARALMYQQQLPRCR